MSESLEEKIIYKILCQIRKGELPTAAPDRDFLAALDKVGIIVAGWDYQIGPVGRILLERGDNKNW
jgi:hypothetical protein